MSKKYLFPCSCGRLHEIEPSQAGQPIPCSCGLVPQAPTLLKIKELPVAPETAEASDKTETGYLRRAFLYLGIVLVVPSLLFLLWTLQTRPHPRDVSKKQVDFVYGQTKVHQDSTPIPNFEHQVLWIQDEHFDDMLPIELFYYFQMLKSGPNFSINFWENYQALRDAFHIRLTTACILILLSIGFIVVSFFLPKKNVVVTGWSGTDWR